MARMLAFFVFLAIGTGVLSSLPPAHARGLLPGKLDVYARSEEDSDPCSQSTKAACNKDDQCTWCTSAAVPSSCFPIRQAKHLPPAVFICDKLGLKDILDKGDDSTSIAWEVTTLSKDVKRSKKSSGQKSKKKKQARGGTAGDAAKAVRKL